MRKSDAPLISVVIPTRNRAGLLRESLASLTGQSLSAAAFEVLVVDDGSSDETRVVSETFGSRLALRYVRLEQAGISAAKNVGIFAANAPILFFFDDDDVAHADLLQQHLDAHRRWPGETAAVLGYTTWAPWLEQSELMHYVTEVGGYLFSYPGIAVGQPLDFRHFWGGRSSCKRAFLARHGTFRQDFDFGCEDIELGFRLSRFDLAVYYEPRAISYMNRPLTLADFCRRCERQGRAQFIFSELHDDPIVDAYCQVDEADAWGELAGELPSAMERLRRLEAAPPRSEEQRREMWRLYDFVFKAHKLKGFVEAREQRHAAVDVAAPC